MTKVKAPAVVVQVTVGDYLDGKATHEAYLESLVVALLDAMKRKRKAKKLPALWWLLPRRSESESGEV